VVFNEETTAHVGTLVKGRVSDMKVHLGDTVKRVRSYSSSKALSWVRRKIPF